MNNVEMDKKNISLFVEMLNDIADRVDGEKSDVFLDILVNVIFKVKNYHHQQAMVNGIAKMYDTEPPALKNDYDEDIF